MGAPLAFGVLVATIAALSCEGSGVYERTTYYAGADASPARSDSGLCVNGQSVDGAYPKAAKSVALHATLPDLAFDALASDGSPTKLSLHEYFEPCAPASRLLVVRMGAAWCGTCLWHYAHTGALRSKDFGDRLRFLDLALASEDGFPPQPFDVATLQRRIDAPDRVGADPKFRLGAINPGTAPLPLYVFVDTRTMIAVDFVTNPDPAYLELRIRQALATVDGTPQPPIPQEVKIDGRFFPDEWDILHGMRLVPAPPPDKTNAKADDPAAAALGKRLFSDATLSPSGTVSCATCHIPDRLFMDGLTVSEAVGRTDRNAPGLGLAAHQRWQFWDGRADTLWMQALGPLENAKEFASSRLFVAHRVYDTYKSDYEAVWGPLPPLSDTARFPADGQPGTPTYDKMAGSDQTLVSRVFANVGKSIAAYERTLRVAPNRLDAYIDGDLNALTSAEKGGLSVFFRLGCPQCHWGPRLTDDAFHATRFPTGRNDGKADVGRQDGQALLLASPFISGGVFSDDTHTGHAVGLAVDPSLTGAFKTPTLRGIPGTAPYGHGGKLATLNDVVTLYSQGGLLPTDTRAAGTAPPWLVTFDHNAKDALLPFLNVLEASIQP